MYQTRAISNPPAGPLIEAVLQVSADEGAEGLTARSIANVAGTSPSTINYQYDSIDDLKSAAWTVADRRLEDAWRSAQANLVGLDLTISDLAPLLFTTVRQIMATYRGCHAVFWDTLLKHNREGWSFETPQSYFAEREFFAAVLNALDRPQTETPLLQAFALALRSGYLIFEQPAHFDAWAFSLVQRFCQRLAQEAPQIANDCAPRKQAEAGIAALQMPAASRHDTAIAILSTARNVAMKDGVSALTHRAIARQAGLSVSSVQHFYGSRASLLSAVYLSVLTELRDKAIAELPKPNSLTQEELVETLLFAASGAEPPTSADQVALLGLVLSASRQAETRVLARGFLANFGQSSTVLLSALKAPRGAIGRLDAQLFSVCSTHFAVLEVCEDELVDSSLNQTQFMAQIVRSLFV